VAVNGLDGGNLPARVLLARTKQLKVGSGLVRVILGLVLGTAAGPVSNQGLTSDGS
jgi:DNA mismatch repair protein MutH